MSIRLLFAPVLDTVSVCMVEIDNEGCETVLMMELPRADAQAALTQFARALSRARSWEPDGPLSSLLG